MPYAAGTTLSSDDYDVPYDHPPRSFLSLIGLLVKIIGNAVTRERIRDVRPTLMDVDVDVDVDGC